MMTLDKVIKILKSDSCSYCTWGCMDIPSCECPDCPLKLAVIEAVRYLEEYKRDKPMWDAILKTNAVDDALMKKYHEYVSD